MVCYVGSFGPDSRIYILHNRDDVSPGVERPFRVVIKCLLHDILFNCLNLHNLLLRQKDFKPCKFFFISTKVRRFCIYFCCWYHYFCVLDKIVCEVYFFMCIWKSTSLVGILVIVHRFTYLSLAQWNSAFSVTSWCLPFFQFSLNSGSYVLPELQSFLGGPVTKV
jgi:hypothetical protein